ncbi:hypothetical protein Q4F19_12615 [Sphingomonas sp. BIUV-7]|uniref:Uncharacterized protein n=1 Tax=Sphingomonas natans TaxID=3063330 RepID=A0ABT8YB50_9SPHN|nr:hypothetical protein [Sphingomonas sp. BIUV-7]MDO6415227.1 hypothetical protein [Sphingomonas sp. BIUV-7]
MTIRLFEHEDQLLTDFAIAERETLIGLIRGSKPGSSHPANKKADHAAEGLASARPFGYFS